MKLIEVEFKGDIVEVIEAGTEEFLHQATLASGAVADDRSLWVSVTKICGNLGMDEKQIERQKEKLKKDDTYHLQFLEMDTAGGKQETLCIQLSQLNGWLFSINHNKVRADIRPNLIKYKNECFDALNDYFNKGAAFKPEVKAELENIILLQNEQIVQMDREINRLKSILIKLHDGFHAQLEKATNIFQLIGNTKKDGGNLNTETIAGHKYWGITK